MFRKVLFWMHLTAGIFAGIVVFIMSITGVLLTYEKQLLAWADRRAAAIEAPADHTPRVSIDTIVERVQRSVPDTAITTILRREDRRAPVSVTMSNGVIVMVHPYTGHVIAEAPADLRRFFRSTMECHRYLAGTGEYRVTGKAVTGACNLAFLFLVLSGLYLWMPKRWSAAAVAAIGIPQWRHATGKARDFNWHNALGFWSAIPLAIVVASATVISYPWASDLAYRVAGEEPPPRPTPPAAGTAQTAPPRPSTAPRYTTPIEPHWTTAEAQTPGWKSISLRMPTQSAGALVFTIDEGWAGQPQKRATLTIDGNSGRIARWEPFENQSAGRRFRSLLRFAHTGEVWGLAGQTVAGLVSAVACVMVYTGFALAWRRFRAWRIRSKDRTRLRPAA
jgi:uncharacterized iron-regulated membrane protein